MQPDTQLLPEELAKKFSKFFVRGQVSVRTASDELYLRIEYQGYGAEVKLDRESLGHSDYYRYVTELAAVRLGMVMFLGGVR